MPRVLVFAALLSTTCPRAWQRLGRGQSGRNMSLLRVRNCVCNPCCASNLCCLNSAQADISEYWDVSIWAL